MHRMGWMALAVFALLTALPAQAQAEEDADALPRLRSVRIVLDVGPTFGWIGTVDVRALAQGGGGVESEEDYPVQVGYQLGLGMHLRRGWLRGRTGVALLNAGALFDGSSFLEEDQRRLAFVTVHAEGEVGVPMQVAQLYVFAGPKLRYRLDVGEAASDFEALEDHLRRISATGSIGAGLRFRLARVTAGPELSYGFDLTGLSDGDLTLREQAVEIVDGFRYSSVEFGLVVSF